VRFLLIIVCALVLIPSASATRKWPSPPAWWMNSSDMRCVRTIESGNGRTSTNLYGMLDGWAVAGGSGSARYASYAEQHYRAWLLWKRFGMRAWCPWDGCC